MNGIALTFVEERKKLPKGTSKFLGNPDVWDGFEWPYYTENGESYDLTFLCQINCTEAAPFDKGGVLLKTGILYFFYDMDLMPQESSDPNAARVLHYDGECSALFEMLRTDHEGNDMSFREMKIHFHADEVPQEKLCARLGGVVTGTEQPLLQVYGFETEKVSIKFPDGHALCFFVRGDYSDVYVRQI